MAVSEDNSDCHDSGRRVSVLRASNWWRPGTPSDTWQHRGWPSTAKDSLARNSNSFEAEIPYSGPAHLYSYTVDVLLVLVSQGFPERMLGHSTAVLFWLSPIHPLEREGPFTLGSMRWLDTRHHTDEIATSSLVIRTHSPGVEDTPCHAGPHRGCTQEYIEQAGSVGGRLCRKKVRCSLVSTGGVIGLSAKLCRQRWWWWGTHYVKD